MAFLYDNPAQMEPLVIDDSRPAAKELLGLAHDLCQASARLDAVITHASARNLSELVAGMNCYYSNLIEGHKTLPLDIDRALLQSDSDGEPRNLQSLARAHIAAARWAQQQELTSDNLADFLLNVHRVFCANLPAEQLLLEDGSSMVPGVFRSQEVTVGRHVAPAAASLNSFLSRFSLVYGRQMHWARQGGMAKLSGIVAAFAAHHRLVWIHPFPDGNGRVARITLDAMLRACGVNGASLWSMSRGLAKHADHYKSLLAQADAPRRGDLDGRGNLSERELAELCKFGLQTAIDQATFMASMLDLDHFKIRVHGYFEKVRYSDMKPEAVHLYLQAFVMGEVERGEAARLTGLKQRSARDVLAALIAEGFLVSDTPKGKVRVGFPLHALASLLPNLYPAGDLDISPAELMALHQQRQF